MGIGVGAGFPLGLTVIAWRTPDGAASAATSGLALGVGYTVAGLGPLLMGVLIDVPTASGRDHVLLLAGAVRGSRPADRRPPRTGDDGQFACRAAFSAMPWPVRGSTSTAPVTELRRNSSPSCPDSVAGRDRRAVGQGDLGAGGDVEAGLDHAVVAEGDADPGVRADQAAPPDARPPPCRRRRACP